jgi:peptidoglycan/LPS O-acetylase OafA/YrhL
VFACLAVIAAACLVHSPAYTMSRAIDWGIPAFLLVCGCLGLERQLARWRWLVHAGNHSYSVYLIHPMILATGWYAQHALRANAWLVMIGCFAAIAGLGAASYHVLELPAGRLVVRWLAGPRGGRLAVPPDQVGTQTAIENASRDDAWRPSR